MKRWIFWVGLLISAFFLFIALRGLQPGNILEVIRNARIIWLIPGIGVYFLALWFRTWRWCFLLKPFGHISLSTLFSTMSIGYMGNNIYPARAGEVLRSILVKRKYQIPISSSLATIMIERVFDAVVIVGFVSINLSKLGGIFPADEKNGGLHSWALWGTILFLLAFFILLTIARFPSQTEILLLRIINFITPLRWRQKISGIINRFIQGLSSLHSLQDLLLILILSVLIWLVETGVYWFIMQAFPFEISFIHLIFLNGIVNLATTLPSAPGYLGTFDASGIALLSFFNVNQSVAVGYILLLHVALWLPVTLLGGFYFMREGLNWTRDVNQIRNQSQNSR